MIAGDVDRCFRIFGKDVLTLKGNNVREKEKRVGKLLSEASP